MENPTVGQGVTTKDFILHPERARAVVIEVVRVEDRRGCPGVTLDFQNHPAGAYNFNVQRATFRRFLPWDRLDELDADPEGAYARIRPFLCTRRDCAFGSGWEPGGRKGTTLDRCPNCGSAIEFKD